MGKSVTMISENQSTYIPLGQKHRLVNPGKVSLEIIEVKSRSHLGEDDYPFRLRLWPQLSSRP
jgi:mannose-1-phosphate guanylyltransferase/mannose-6-phosphate isomerase